jgi:hypothetical protein
MPRGGARNRSGPPPDPKSGRSDRRGFRLDALPAEGHRGEAPNFPLPNAVSRELELWEWAWRTPQAAAWNREPWRWQMVGMWVRTMVVCESHEATAADKNSLHRFADQIGMTPAGLKENGWKIAADEVGAKRADAVPAVEDDPDDVRGRLTVVRDAVG